MIILNIFLYSSKSLRKAVIMRRQRKKRRRMKMRTWMLMRAQMTQTQSWMRKVCYCDLSVLFFISEYIVFIRSTFRIFNKAIFNFWTRDCSWCALSSVLVYYFGVLVFGKKKTEGGGKIWHSLNCNLKYLTFLFYLSGCNVTWLGNA